MTDYMEIERRLITYMLRLADKTMAALRQHEADPSWLFSERANLDFVTAIWPAESEEFGYGSMTLKGEKYVQAAALAAVKNGQTDIEGRCTCLHVVDEEAAESLRRKVGDGRLN